MKIATMLSKIAPVKKQVPRPTWAKPKDGELEKLLAKYHSSARLIERRLAKTPRNLFAKRAARNQKKAAMNKRKTAESCQEFAKKPSGRRISLASRVCGRRPSNHGKKALATERVVAAK